MIFSKLDQGRIEIRELGSRIEWGLQNSNYFINAIVSILGILLVFNHHLRHILKTYISLFLLLLSVSGFSSPGNFLSRDSSTPTSTAAEALSYINSIRSLDRSDHWPNVDPVVFLQNLKTFTISPLRFYEGKGTNFCAFSALSYIPVTHDPLGYARFMISLYKDGTAQMGVVVFRPSESVKKAAGNLKYKGVLDIHPAAQMWFLSLADHFKGYLNVFNRRYNPGDEDNFWASTNYAKFNRMLRKLFLLKVNARGSDLIRPGVGDRYEYLEKKMKTGLVFLYLNNRLLYKKDHVFVRFGIPTHFVLLVDIYKNGDKINIVYWDYGIKTLQVLEPKFLRKIIFGITHCPTLPK